MTGSRFNADPSMGRRELLMRLAAISSTLFTGCASRHSGRAQSQGGTPDWPSLQKRIQGRAVPLGAVNYEENRRAMVWNAVKPERFPDAIVRVKSEADVRESVRFARQHNLKVGVRGGGHHWHNPALRQGGLLLDLSGLNRLQVDAQHRTAVVQPGVTGAMLMANLAPHGLAFPVGHEGPVALSGFLLNGGLGWNYRVWGPSCSSIEAIDLVDAHGESIRADRDHNADLFWAARGAGPGFFGVVIRFHLRVYPLPRAILQSSLTYGIQDIDKVAAWLPQLMRSVPLNVELGCRGVAGRGDARNLIISAHAFADTIPAARDALGAFEAVPAGITALDRNLYDQLSVEDVFGRVTTEADKGPRCRGESVWSNASPDVMLSNIGAGIRAAPSRPDQASFAGLGLLWLDRNSGQQPDMAFSMSGSIYAGAYTLWTDATRDAANTAWVRDAMTALEPLKVGHYVGENDLRVAPDRAKQCFSPSAWDKLVRLKREYDPEDLFFSFMR